MSSATRRLTRNRVRILTLFQPFGGFLSDGGAMSLMASDRPLVPRLEGKVDLFVATQRQPELMLNTGWNSSRSGKFFVGCGGPPLKKRGNGRKRADLWRINACFYYREPAPKLRCSQLRTLLDAPPPHRPGIATDWLVTAHWVKRRTKRTKIPHKLSLSR
jgi:hypothetical protein